MSIVCTIFKGFNIWNVIFDFSGGLLSLLQLFFDCVGMNDFSGIWGNRAKLVLSLITLVFDVSLWQFTLFMQVQIIAS